MFSVADVEQQLALLGISDVPREVLEPFVRNLHARRIPPQYRAARTLLEAQERSSAGSDLSFTAAAQAVEATQPEQVSPKASRVAGGDAQEAEADTENAPPAAASAKPARRVAPRSTRPAAPASCPRPRRRADPVSRFRELQEGWKRDPFLSKPKKK
jgi:hypothetical protein